MKLIIMQFTGRDYLLPYPSQFINHNLPLDATQPMQLQKRRQINHVLIPIIFDSVSRRRALDT